MGDLVMVGLVLAFFAVCVGYVRWCGSIIGPDPTDDGPPSASESPAATTDRDDAVLVER